MKKHLLASVLLAGLPLAAVNAAPLQVYILSGQSNMQGHAHVSTLDHMAKDPETAPLLEKMLGPDGQPKTCDDVWISYLSEGRGGTPTVKEGRLTAGFGAGEDKIGPEFAFGVTMAEHVDGPILLIKTAWGGKSLHTDFRPPSASEEGAGEYYRKMVEHVRGVLEDPGTVVEGYRERDGFELKGFVWFQGWNDMVAGGVYPQRGQEGGYDLYTENLVHFIRDVRSDFEAPELPFVIGVMGAGGPTSMYTSQRYVGIHQNFRDAMAAPASMPEFEDDVAAVLTEKYWDHELDAARSKKKEERTEQDLEILKGVSNQQYHYLGAAKILAPIGEAFAQAMVELQE